MLSHHGLASAADASLAAQPASARALAIPEILERVLQWSGDEDLLRARRVCHLWQSTSEALLLRGCQNRYLKLTTHSIFVYIGVEKRPFDILSILQRKPELGYSVKKITASFAVSPSAAVEMGLHTFVNLEYLRTIYAGKQLASLHRVTSLSFASLREADLFCELDGAAAQHNERDPVLHFLSSLVSLRHLHLEASSRRSLEKAWIQEQFASLFSSLPLLERADVDLDLPCSLSLAHILPRGLKELAIDADDRTMITLVQALEDTMVLPKLTCLPETTLGSTGKTQWSALLMTWAQRSVLKDVEADLLLIRETIDGKYDDSVNSDSGDEGGYTEFD